MKMRAANSMPSGIGIQVFSITFILRTGGGAHTGVVDQAGRCQPLTAAATAAVLMKSLRDPFMR